MSRTTINRYSAEDHERHAIIEREKEVEEWVERLSNDRYALAEFVRMTKDTEDALVRQRRTYDLLRAGKA